MAVSMRGASRLRLIVLPAALAATAGAAHAVDRAWLNPVSGSWITPANWTPTGFPTSGDTATISVASVSPYTVTLANGVTISALTINHPQATLQVNPGAGLTMGTGPINVNSGVFSMGSASLTGTGAFTLSPGATLSLNGTTMPSGMTYALNGNTRIQNTVQGFTTAGFTNNGAMTLTGAGLAWLFCPPLTNNGTLTVDGVGGGTGRLQTSMTNAPTGSIVLNADTETFRSPQNNSGSITLAAGKTLTVGSFASVNQNAGSMTINGAYTHVLGTFNMAGGALSIPAGGSFFKDGGSFVYNDGAITGEPTLRNVFLTLNPGATGTPTFRVRGPSNGLSGEVFAYATLNVEATPTEGALTGVFGGFTNRGVINLIGDEVNAATIATGGGTITNFGTIIASAPAAPPDGGPHADGFALALGLMDAALELSSTGTLTVEKGASLSAGSPSGTSSNLGTINIDADGGLGGNATLNIILPAGATQFSGGNLNIIAQNGATATFSTPPGVALQTTSGFITNVRGFDTGRAVADASVDVFGGTVRTDGNSTQIGVFGQPNLVRSDGVNAGFFVAIASSTIVRGSSLSVGPGAQVLARGYLALVMNAGGSPAPLTNAGDMGVSGDTASRGRGSGEVPGVGALTFDGFYDQQSTGAITFDIGGLTPGTEHDRMDATQPVSLDGTLELRLFGAFQPEWGDAFTIMTFPSRTGDFALFTTPALADPNLRWWRSAGATAYSVGVRHIADTNHDGVVDFLDLNNVLSYFGQPAPAGSAASIGDANTDGVVDFLDLNHVLGAFGTSAP